MLGSVRWMVQPSVLLREFALRIFTWVLQLTVFSSVSMKDFWILNTTTLDDVLRLRFERGEQTAAYTGRSRELFKKAPPHAERRSR